MSEEKTDAKDAIDLAGLLRVDAIIAVVVPIVERALGFSPQGTNGP